MGRRSTASRRLETATVLIPSYGEIAERPQAPTPTECGISSQSSRRADRRLFSARSATCRARYLRPSLIFSGGRGPYRPPALTKSARTFVRKAPCTDVSWLECVIQIDQYNLAKSGSHAPSGAVVVKLIKTSFFLRCCNNFI